MKSVSPLTAPVTAAESLRRIALLLERSRAGTYRVEAFRKALKVVDKLSDDDLAARVDGGRLTELTGIGKSTAAVITQAVHGELPEYLESLQDKEIGALADGGEELYAATIGDLHTHSDWSDGGSPIIEMVRTAIDLGQDWMALTDHSPRLTVANGLSAERLTEQLGVVDKLNRALGEQFRLLRGIEVDILDDGSLDQTDEMLGQLEIVTASVHSKLKMDAGPMTRRMVAAARDPRVNVLGHCTGRLVTGGRGQRAQSKFDARAVFEACAESVTAVEINSRPERVDPPDELIELARDLGCLFAIDSDAHAPGQLDFKELGCERATRLGIDADRIVTTWPVERVLEWANSRRQ
ncbi:PHP domain-containing protein [Williamsia sp. 1138]|uniref:PHP domain-containing protein n=1 Tax=Williamsia sp. 1138 TaxID=1903117 RepID=UPI000A0FC914|nr:PHP domain-containing protein [Williamsia sp. 1138]OZG27678.1 PHP domain-containing protein [Williamsia sp. 1138]